MNDFVGSAYSNQTGLAALATVLSFHGVSATVDDLVHEGDNGELTPFGFLERAMSVGFEATPLEGPFDALDECEPPFVVSFGEMKDRFATVIEVNETEVVLADAQKGKTVMSSEAFRAEWEREDGDGDIYFLEPQATALEQFRKSIGEKRSQGAGRWKAGAIYGAGLVVPILLFKFFPAFSLLSVGLASAFLFSLASFSEKECVACNTAKLSAGLPLAEAGMIVYGALFATSFFYDGVLLTVPLAMAAGGHLFLLRILFKQRLLCWPCIFTLSVVWFSLGVHGPVSQAGWPVILGAFLLGTAILGVCISLFVKYLANAMTAGVLQLAGKVIASEPPPENGKVRVIAYKRSGCSGCTYYQTVVRAMLYQNFHGSIEIEERDASHLDIGVPLLIIRGYVDIVVGRILPPHSPNNVLKAVDMALDPNKADLRESRGLVLMDIQ